MSGRRIPSGKAVNRRLVHDWNRLHPVGPGTEGTTTTEGGSATGSPRPAVPSVQFLRCPCDCGKPRGWRFVEHYDVVRCVCGNYFWALRPKRNGPLVAKPYPRIFFQS